MLSSNCLCLILPSSTLKCMWLWQLLQTPWHMWLLFAHFQDSCNSFSHASLLWTKWKCAPTAVKLMSPADIAVILGFGKDPGAVVVYYLYFERKIFSFITCIKLFFHKIWWLFFFSWPPLPIPIYFMSKFCPLGPIVSVNWMSSVAPSSILAESPDIVPRNSDRVK